MWVSVRLPDCCFDICCLRVCVRGQEALIGKRGINWNDRFARNDFSVDSRASCVRACMRGLTSNTFRSVPRVYLFMDLRMARRQHSIYGRQILTQATLTHEHYTRHTYDHKDTLSAHSMPRKQRSTQVFWKSSLFPRVGCRQAYDTACMCVCVCASSMSKYKHQQKWCICLQLLDPCRSAALPLFASHPSGRARYTLHIAQPSQHQSIAQRLAL